MSSRGQAGMAPLTGQRLLRAVAVWCGIRPAEKHSRSRGPIFEGPWKESPTVVELRRVRRICRLLKEGPHISGSAEMLDSVRLDVISLTRPFCLLHLWPYACYEASCNSRPPLRIGEILSAKQPNTTLTHEVHEVLRPRVKMRRSAACQLAALAHARERCCG